jgi:hypothetical protein
MDGAVKYLALAALVTSAAGLLALPASAEDERLTPPLIIDGEVGRGIWLYGQVNKGILFANDGNQVNAYPLVDNANSSTRAGIWFKTELSDEFTFAANLEYEWNPYSTGNVNRLNKSDVDWDTHKMRKAEGVLQSPYGTLWLGQGAMASDGSSEVDLSGTSLVAYSSVADSAGGQLFTTNTGAVSTISVGSAFSNLDGLSRLTRVRYDTPTFKGLTLKTSAGFDAISGDEDIGWDLAGTYERQMDEVELNVGLGYGRPNGDFNRLSGSASVLHKETGLNLTFAAGSDDKNGSDPVFFYGKLGWKPTWTDAAKTAFAIDMFSGDDMTTAGSDSFSIGFGAVHSLEQIQTDLYLTVRWHEYDDSAASYEPVTAVLTGFRFWF